MFKKIIAWPLAWGLFWIGHIVSFTVTNGWLGGITYRFYNWFMFASVTCQDWAGLQGPWSEPEPTDEDTVTDDTHTAA
jgi:hypothetical protein